ncbi:MAG: type II toxin-antitoxin system RelE/ParE family toxin [Nanoarchaeota archaeon]
MGERVSVDTICLDRILKPIKDRNLRIKIFKQIEKIINNPEVGKPMRNVRGGTREVYISPFRLSYVYLKEENKIIFLDLYHKDKQ